jgi:hypothetical protein
MDAWLYDLTILQFPGVSGSAMKGATMLALPFPKITLLWEIQCAQRHVKNSIRALRRLLGVALAGGLGHCQHCAAVSVRLNL